jgi:Tfp pilus assembly protein FimT
MYRRYRSNVYSAGSRAFALVELLVVIALMIILTSISLPALSSMSKSQRMNQTVTEVGGVLEQARQYAIAQHTYVWVVFHTRVVDGLDRVYVSIVASRDGTDPGVYGNVPSTSFELVSKVKSFQQIQLKEAGAFTASQVTSLPLTPVVTSLNALSTTTTFNIQLPGDSTRSPFSQTLVFTPSGEAQNGGSPIDIIEFALEPAQNKTLSNPDNVAVVRLNGITGQAFVYRR